MSLHSGHIAQRSMSYFADRGISFVEKYETLTLCVILSEAKNLVF